MSRYKGTLSGTNDNGVSWTYTGDLVKGIVHGDGRIEWTDGQWYSGSWENGFRSGKGTYKWRDGSVYVGDFNNGKLEGYGVLIYPNGSIKEGRWSNDFYVQNQDENLFHYDNGKKSDTKEINNLIHNLRKIIENQQEKRDILSIVYANINDIRNLAIDTKKRANVSFYSSIFFGIVGLMLISVAIFYTILFETGNIQILCATSGAITELFALIIYRVYKQASKQFELYYTDLSNDKELLLLLSVTNNIKDDKWRDQVLAGIIKTRLFAHASNVGLIKTNEMLSKDTEEIQM